MNETIQNLAISYALNIVAAMLIFVIGRWAAKAITGLVRRLMDKRGVDAMLTSFVTHLGYAAMLAFVIIAALGRLGIQTASFIAVLGAAGLAIGLALQGSLSNFAAGVLIIIFRPFKVGDYVEAGGTAGVVEEMHIFSTQFKTADNKTIIVPNSSIVGGNIVNFSSKDTRRVDLVFGIGYDDDIRTAKDIIKDVLNKDERVLSEPEATVAVLELADSSVNLAVRPWVNSADYWPVYFDLNETVKLRFDEAGISIPYPQSDIHIHRQT